MKSTLKKKSIIRSRKRALWGLKVWITQDRFCFTKLCSIPKESPSLQTTLGHISLWSGLNSYVSQDSFGCKWWKSSTNRLNKREFITEHNWKVKASGVARSQGSCNVSHIYLALSSLFAGSFSGRLLPLSGSSTSRLVVYLLRNLNAERMPVSWLL